MTSLPSYRNLLIAGFLVSLGSAACKKSSGSGPGTIIYVAGSISATGGPVPVYWKNGHSTQLPGTGKYGASAAITIQGSDVYIAGRMYNSANSLDASMITYWKNAVATTLPNNNKAGTATGIAISGTDVYVTGYSYNLTYSANDEPVPVYWKNGVVDTLATPGNHAQTVAIAVQGSDVYIAGYFFDGSGATSMYWKNGVMRNMGEGFASAIAVSGSDVYVAGDTHGGSSGQFVASCWKNGSLIPLAFTDPTYYPGHASAITVSGNNVYVAGNTLDINGTGTSVATYWKNGIPVQLGYGTGDAIFVAGSDVYVAGSAYNSSGKLLPTYWKNGIPTTLPGIGSPAAIAVVPPQ